MENQAISSDLIRGHIDTIILHTLIDQDRHAQSITDTVDKKSDGKYQINQATLYSSLKRLENLELVSSYWHDCEDGRRKYFKITEKGKKTVDDNLSNWSFSREIINQLMDVNDSLNKEKQVEIQYVEKIVEKPVYIEKIIEKQPKTEEKPEKNDELPLISLANSKSKLTEKEVNFRNILNGLIEYSEKQRLNNTELKPIENENNNKQNFNEIIDTTDYNDQKDSINGKIDYGDLTLKASKEGYKIRVSSKDSAKQSNGNLYMNKLNLMSSVLFFVLACIELSIIYFKIPTAFEIKYYILTLFVYLIPTLIFFINNIKNAKKTFDKYISSSEIITCAIIIFNLLLITFAINFLLDVNFQDTKLILWSLIIPIITMFDVLGFFVIRFILSKSKSFYSEK